MNEDTAKTEFPTIGDGILNKKVYEDWDKTPVRILFLLQEANDLDGENSDSRDSLNEGERSQTWDNVVIICVFKPH